MQCLTSHLLYGISCMLCSISIISCVRARPYVCACVRACARVRVCGARARVRCACVCAVRVTGCAFRIIHHVRGTRLDGLHGGRRRLAAVPANLFYSFYSFLLDGGPATPCIIHRVRGTRLHGLHGGRRRLATVPGADGGEAVERVPRRHRQTGPANM